MTPTLTGTLPGLLRRCSPVVDADGRTGIVVSDIWLGFANVSWDNCPYLDDEKLKTISLDLSDETGVFHARLWAGTDPERLEVIRAAGVDTSKQAVPVVYQTPAVSTIAPNHGGWRYEDGGYIHESDLRIAGNGMRSWLYRLGQPGIIKELPINITGVKCHGFTVRADVAALMDYADEMIGKEGGE